MTAQPSPDSFFPRLAFFDGHAIMVQREDVHHRAKLLKSYNPGTDKPDSHWLSYAQAEIERGDVQHWYWLHPAIEAAFLEINAMICERSNPPNYDAAGELWKQARKLRAECAA